MYYRFSVDDNIWILRDLSKGNYSSLFDHPYLALYRSLHEKYGAKFQFNIYYETEDFDLSQMTDRFKAEWIANSNWLRLSFHARADAPPFPYAESSYEEAFEDCTRVNSEIIRFAGEETLDLFTTIHYCQASPDAVRAFRDAGLKGLVGLFTPEQSCYGLLFKEFNEPYKYDECSGLYYFVNDMIVNLYPLESIVALLEKVYHKEFIEVMIHEQYFYKDFHMYQPDFAAKVETCIKHLTDEGRKSVFLDELIYGHVV